MRKMSEDVSFDVTDISNESDIYNVDKDSEFRIREILIPPQIRIMFLIFCGGMIIFSLIYGNVLAAGFFILMSGFIADLLGMFDSVDDFMKQGRKPRGGYDNIE